MQNLFTGDFDVERLVQGFKAETNVDIKPDNTLIILDEVQEVPKALTALKYFYENAPKYHIIVAGSPLGIATHERMSFPVGKVDYIELYPLTFSEFLLALNETQLVDLMFKKTDYKLLSVFHDKLINLLKTYFYIGGMPEVVASYTINKSWNEARDIQKKILYTYNEDFSKFVPQNIVPRVRQVWKTIPAQLAKENKKFIYNLIREGARAKEYELALMWLEDAGLIHRLNRIEAPRLPISSYADSNAFKIYHLDVGLLAAMTNLGIKTLLADYKQTDNLYDVPLYLLCSFMKAYEEESVKRAPGS